MDARAFWDSVDTEVTRRAHARGVDFYGINSFDVGDIVVVYADVGDPYKKTVCAIVRGRSVTYEYAMWGDLLEEFEELEEEA